MLFFVARGDVRTREGRAEAKRVFWAALKNGSNQREASRIAGVSPQTGVAWMRDLTDSSSSAWKNRDLDDLPLPKRPKELEPKAKRALDDFGYFRRRYFGRIASPWQEQAAETIVELLATPDREYAVINAPPGGGKSALFAHDIPVWLTCRNRGIRGIVGSRTETQARKYLGRIRRTLERQLPVKAPADLLRKGRALDAEATLIHDYGRFQTMDDLWRAEAFVVAQADGIPIEEKEPTWSAFGMNSGQLGMRVDFIIWDDLVDKTTVRSIEQAEEQAKWWEEEAETRLEPDGLLILQGQRLSSRDLYRHCLNMRVPVDEEVDFDEVETANPDSALFRPKYHHVKFQAHYDELCNNIHRVRDGAKPYPEGCLLDPVRLPWHGSGGLAAIKTNRPDKFEVVYQQEDVDPANVLVQPIWIKGGRGIDGVDYLGCEDRDRGLCEAPDLTVPVFSIACADPSPTKFWAIGWWLYHPATEQRILMDLIRKKMEAPDFLDRLHPSGDFVGVMEEWQIRSRRLGFPITHWIVEKNAAQRFMLQYQHTKDWQRKRGVNIVPHETHVNKSDPDLGVWSLAPHYQYGRIRLPRRGAEARVSSQKLIDEVTRYPDGSTDDCVMQQWFLEWNLPRLARRTNPVEPQDRPGWLRRNFPARVLAPAS